MSRAFRLPASVCCTVAAMLFSACRGESTKPSTATLLSAPDRYLRRSDVTIRYRDFGRGTPVMLIHGYSDRVEMWAGPADSIARSHRVIVPDVRGFGKSTKFNTPDRFGRSMVDDLIALLDERKIDRVHVIGYSMGGVIATQLAIRIPDRIASATLVAGAFFEDSVRADSSLAPFADALQDGRGMAAFIKWIVPTLHDTVVSSVVSEVMSYNDLGSLVAVMRAFGALNPNWDDLHRTQIPMVAVTGADDPFLPHSRRVVSHWPGSRLQVVAGGNHINITNLPEMLAAFRSVAEPVAVARRPWSYVKR